MSNCSSISSPAEFLLTAKLGSLENTKIPKGNAGQHLASLINEQYWVPSAFSLCVIITTIIIIIIVDDDDK